jgi:accessory colonization factor AcfC
MRHHAGTGVIMALEGKAVAASLTVYGPGGPYQAIRKCADIFGAKFCLSVEVRADEPAKQADQAAKDGDVYYTGAEYMMDDFIRDYPGLVDEPAIIYPAARRVGIIVRQGNPKGIGNLDDLATPGVRILDVRLENMDGLRGAANANVTISVTTGRQGLATWMAAKDLDAWVTYKTWAAQLEPGTGEFIPIDGPEGLRRVPTTVMRKALHPERAKAFLEFLKTDEARAVFLENGYEPY